MKSQIENGYKAWCSTCKVTSYSYAPQRFCPTCGTSMTPRDEFTGKPVRDGGTKRRPTINEAQSTVLQYLSKLTGRSTDEMIGEALEQWLTANYADTVEAAEARCGLPTSVVLTPRGRFSVKAHDTMLANLKRLA
jgi:uncharacterized Zn finger protein (UPF0148 family)